MLILNDIHIGFRRIGGTTPASQEALREALLSNLQATLQGTAETHALVMGDLFDDFEVSPRDWVSAFNIFTDWVGKNKALTLVAGNHDHSPRALKVSSFEVLGHVLAGLSPLVKVVGIDEWAVVSEGIAVLAHCSNQDIFNQKLSEVPRVGVSALLLHANYDNDFAAQSDHSLNVSKEQAWSFRDAGVRLYFAHEHQARTELSGWVKVFGNQFPTSVADCLGNDSKFAHILQVGETGAVLVPVETWTSAGPQGYEEIDWRALSDMTSEHRSFVRVTGTASAAESSDVINTIAKFRTKSNAFVITNAVSVDGIVTSEELPASFEAAKTFDVMEYIKRHLDEDEFTAVQGLLQE